MTERYIVTTMPHPFRNSEEASSVMTRLGFHHLGNPDRGWAKYLKNSFPINSSWAGDEIDHVLITIRKELGVSIPLFFVSEFGETHFRYAHDE